MVYCEVLNKIYKICSHLANQFKITNFKSFFCSGHPSYDFKSLSKDSQDTSDKLRERMFKYLAKLCKPVSV